MQEIIKEGSFRYNTSENAIINLFCHKCGCEFKSNEYNINWTEKRINGISQVSDTCPYCKNIVTLNIGTSKIRRSK